MLNRKTGKSMKHQWLRRLKDPKKKGESTIHSECNRIVFGHSHTVPVQHSHVHCRMRRSPTDGTSFLIAHLGTLRDKACSALHLCPGRTCCSHTDKTTQGQLPHIKLKWGGSSTTCGVCKTHDTGQVWVRMPLYV